MYELYSRKDSLVEYAPQWEQWYNRMLKCSVCGWPDPKKFDKPKGIDVVVRQLPKGFVACADAFPELLHEELYKVLAPYCGHSYIGRCYFQRKPDGEVIETPYLTMYTTPEHTLEAHRGKYCRHDRCKGCGKISNKVFWASGAVLRRNLDKRGVYQDVFGGVYIRSLLAESLKLTQTFADLKLYKVAIIDEPLDGDTLPGDPGWAGVLKARRLPRCPENEPPRGRWTA